METLTTDDKIAAISMVWAWLQKMQRDKEDCTPRNKVTQAALGELGHQIGRIHDDMEAHIVVLRKHRDDHDRAVEEMQAQHDEVGREMERTRQQPQPDSE